MLEESKTTRYQRIRKQRINTLINECLNRVNTDIEEKEMLTEAPIKVSLDTALKNPAQVKQLATKADVILTDPSLKESEDINDNEIEKITPTDLQQQGIEKLKSWCLQLGLDLTGPELTLSDDLKYSYFEPAYNAPVPITVYTDGYIKISGHVVSKFEDFKKVIDFHKEKR